ncbi:IS1182 family transposase [Micromonospora sp. ATA32]|nr:IS1182 family transposase [Micromonospora sp. ATA32]
MSLQPAPWPEPSQEIAVAVQAMYRGRRAPLAVVIRDELGELYADEVFAAAFGVRGRPGWSPGRLMLVTVLQFAEHLTDRQAAEAVRVRIDWKYGLGLDLADDGFDPSILAEFRARLVEHAMVDTALDLLLAALVARGLLKPGGKQRTDSTHVLAAVRDLNRLELAGESVRAALEALAVTAPDWLADTLDVTDWTARYGVRVDSWRLPGSQTKRDALAAAYGADGFTLLRAVYAPHTPAWLAQLPAVDVLRQVLLQNYVIVVDRRGREVITRREADVHGLPPGRCRITSPYDTDARRGGKRDLFWTGYKVHLSETCTDEQDGDQEGGPGEQSLPNIITNVATTDAAVPDAAMTTPIHESLARRGLLPDEHLVDSGYPSADLLVESADRFGIHLITPMLADVSAQARAGAGFDAAAFDVDFDTHTVTCPQGKTSTAWSPARQRGVETIVVKFDTDTCRACPVKTQCTTARRGGRQLTIRPRRVQEALTQARARQTTARFRQTYRLRAGVEGTIRQAVAVTDTRHARYRGLHKTHLQHVLSGVALNFIRLDAWFNDVPLDRSRTSHLSRLDLTLAA